MKKQMKQNLLTAVVGLSLSGAFFMDAANNAASLAAAQTLVVREVPMATPAPAAVATEPSGLSFDRCLKLVTSFIHGESVDFGLLTGEEQTFIQRDLPQQDAAE